jgi:transmembrane 9 superfamily protein 2/4
VQCLGMVMVTLIFAVLGFLSPANRGALLSAVVVMFVLMGAWAGYSASRLYKMMAGTAWKRLTTMTGLFYPGLIFLIFFIVNFFIWNEKSSGAVPFSTLVALLSLWFCISLPLVILGAYFGFKQKAIETPVRTNQIPRQVHFITVGIIFVDVFNKTLTMAMAMAMDRSPTKCGICCPSPRF